MLQVPLYSKGVESKEIEAFASIDDADAYLLNYRWHLNPNGYAERRAKGKRVYMHRQLLGLKQTEKLVDHINRDRVDNRRSNLRIVDAAGNSQNKSAQKRNSSGIRGAHLNKQTGRWQAVVVLNGKKHGLGTYEDATTAGAVAAEWRREHMPFSEEAGGVCIPSAMAV